MCGENISSPLATRDEESMKIVLDIDKLLADGEINRAEYEKLLALSSHSAASSAFNLLIGFGVIAIAAGVIALVPNLAEIVGFALAVSSLSLRTHRREEWRLLSTICLVVGALILAGALVARTDGHYLTFTGIGVGFLGVSFPIGSGLLACLGTLALASAVGAGTAYSHASYFIWVERPTIAILLFTIAAVGFYHASVRLPNIPARSALFASRTSVFLVNLGFWIGSLWGDRLYSLPPALFSLTWTAGIIGAGIWAVRNHRLWLLNVSAVFGGIHFYTQYFSILGFHPLSILLGGIGAVLSALALWRVNRGKSI